MSSNSARPGKPGKASSTLRRQELRRRLPRTTGEFWVRLRKPQVVYGLITSTVFVVMLTSLIAWAQGARRPYVGELIDQPIVNLVDFEVEDRAHPSLWNLDDCNRIRELVHFPACFEPVVCRTVW